MIKKMKGGNYSNSNSFATSVNSTTVNSVNSKAVSSITKYLIIGVLILLLVIAFGLGIYFYKKSKVTPTEMPTPAPTTPGPYHPSKLLDDNKNNKVVAIIKGQLKDFGNNYDRLDKSEKRKFRRCFKNPLNNNCSF